MIETNKKELLIGLLSDTHVSSRTNKVPDIIIEDFIIGRFLVMNFFFFCSNDFRMRFL